GHWLLSEPPGHAAEDLYRSSLLRTQGEPPPPVLSRIGLAAGLGRRRVDGRHYDYDYLAVLTRALLARLRADSSVASINVTLPTIGALFHPRSDGKPPKAAELTTFSPDNDGVRDSLALAFSGSGVRNVRVQWAHAVIRDILNDCLANPASPYVT